MINLDEQNFQKEVLESEDLVLVDMYADWCPPCKVMLPLVEKISDSYKGKIKVFKVNVDQAKEIALEYKVETIPTLIFFKKGQIVDKIIGAVPYQFLAEKVEQRII